MGRVHSIQPYVPENSANIRSRGLALRSSAFQANAVGAEAEIFSALMAQFVAFHPTTETRVNAGDDIVELRPIRIIEETEDVSVSSNQDMKAQNYANATRSYKAAAALASAFEGWNS